MQLIIIILVVLFICYAALIIYYWQSWVKIPLVNSQWSMVNSEESLKKIYPFSIHNSQLTIIIPARNEAHNIKACIDSVLNQTYPKEKYEVIVVDDFSTDETAAIVKSYGNKVTLISLAEHLKATTNSYKKRAIEKGIEFAKGEIIVTTDADCIVSHTWLQNISGAFMSYRSDGGPQDRVATVFVVAPVAYKINNSFIEIFQALDFMVLQGITGASVYKKMHSMCNGANLAYRKKTFYEVNGFEGIDAIASGDDMLLMHKIFKKHPNGIIYLKSQQAIVQTQPMKTVKDFFNQRVRWASKADKYDDKRIFVVLLMVYLFNALLIMLPIMGLINNVQCSMLNTQFSMFQFWIVLLISKTLIELIFLFPVSKFFNKQQLLWWFPVAQPFHIIYTVIAGWLGKFGSYKWKERKVK